MLDPNAFVTSDLTTSLNSLLKEVDSSQAYIKLPKTNWLFYTRYTDGGEGDNATNTVVLCVMLEDEVHMFEQHRLSPSELQTSNSSPFLRYTGTSKKVRELLEIEDSEGRVTIRSLTLLFTFCGPESAADWLQEQLGEKTEAAPPQSGDAQPMNGSSTMTEPPASTTPTTDARVVEMVRRYAVPLCAFLAGVGIGFYIRGKL